MIAIAILAYAGANISHEIIGHCGTMALLGGKCSYISTTYIRTTPELPLEWLAGNTRRVRLGLAIAGSHAKPTQVELSRREDGWVVTRVRHGWGSS